MTSRPVTPLLLDHAINRASRPLIGSLLLTASVKARPSFTATKERNVPRGWAIGLKFDVLFLPCTSFSAIKSGWTRISALLELVCKILAIHDLLKTLYNTAETVIATV